MTLWLDFMSRVKYKGTSDLYELISKKIPDDYIENDKLAYKSV